MKYDLSQLSVAEEAEVRDEARVAPIAMIAALSGRCTAACS